VRKRRWMALFFSKKNFFLFYFYVFYLRNSGNSHTARRGATACNTEGTAVSEITSIVRNLDGSSHLAAHRNPVQVSGVSKNFFF
jgi:hypothetical protein